MTKPKTKGITKDELIVIGTTCAVAFMDARMTAETTQQKLLLDIAKAHCEDEQHITNILDGFAKGLQDKGVTDSGVRTRKSEFKTVFLAVAQTRITKDAETKLDAFKGTYHEFIELCRELKGAKERTSTSRNRTKTELTAKQYAKVETQVENANAKQLAELADTTLTQIHKVASPELAGLQTLFVMQSAALSLLKNGKAEEFFKATAQQVLDIVEPAIEKAQAAMEESKQIQAQIQNPAQVQTAQEGEVQAH